MARPHDRQVPREPAQRLERNQHALLELLARIDTEGWDGPTATELLQYLRTTMVRPLTIDVGLRGAAASQAESTGWAAVWVALKQPSLRTARSPWGVLWRAARCAVLEEIVSSQFACDSRRGWDLTSRSRAGLMLAPVSLEKLLEVGWEPSSRSTPETSPELDDAVRSAAKALGDVGWEPDLAQRIVAEVVDLKSPAADPRSTALGWRLLATDLDLPAWQARRLTLVLRGTSQWRGLIARILAGEPEAARSPAMRRALRSTRFRSHRSPVLAAERTAQGDHPEVPQDLAS